MEKFQVCWFSTGRDQAASQLLIRVLNEIIRGEIAGKISFVFSDREQGEALESETFLKLVKWCQIPLICLSSKKFKSSGGYKRFSPEWHLEYDREVMKLLKGFNPDICVLAGYMLIVGPEMCQKYKMINLHPALPEGPIGSWQEVTQKLIENQATETGAMMHLVTPELDRGPVITYCRFSLRGKPFDEYWEEIKGRSLKRIKRWERQPLFKEIRKHGLAREFPLILATLKAFDRGEVKIEGDKVINVDGEVINGYNLTEEIDTVIRLSS